ncbi:MAG: C4-type zinc ribbon domain-containing protein [Sedimentisphaerales bacterium]|nr:C4-type zinc ribbon domain-containing protein [Sedimentisphaerales bacterium]
MGSLLNALVRLQAVEDRLRAAKARLVRCKRTVAIHESRIKAEQATLEAKREEIKRTKMQCDRLDLELKTRDQEIAKYRAALNTARTNKEYATLLTQLNTTKADNSKLETQILELMKGIEAEEAECDALQAQIEEHRRQLEQIRTETEAAAAKLQAEVDQIQAEWDEVASTIPPDVLEIFKRVAETYDGKAVVEIEQGEGRSHSYSCGGCFMGVTTESVNLLMTKDEIIRCPNCTRILVLGKTQAT